MTDAFDRYGENAFDRFEKKDAFDRFETENAFDRFGESKGFMSKVTPFLKGIVKETIPFKPLVKAGQRIVGGLKHTKEYGLPEQQRWEEIEAIPSARKRMLKIKEAEPIESSILEDPVTALTMGAVTGGVMAARSGQAALQIAKESAKGAIGELTYGATEVPGIVKGLSKGAIKATKIPKIQMYSKESDELVDNLWRYMTKSEPPIKIDKPIVEIKEVAKKAKVPKVGKYAKPSSINLERLDTSNEAKQFIQDHADIVGIKKPLTHKEIIEASQEVDVLKQVYTEKEMLNDNAKLLATRDYMVALSEKGELTKEIMDKMKIVSSFATGKGRGLNALKIKASSEMYNPMLRLAKKFAKLGIDADEVIKAAKGIDWDDNKQVTELYRKFVKPKLSEIIDEFRYINLLSSPKTHEINFTTNAIQGMVVRPATRIAAAGWDAVRHLFTGKEREFYFKQIPAYYKGAFGSIGESFRKSLEVIKGKRGVYRPDLNRIPTNAKLLRPFQSIPRMMEAGDIFWRTLITGAETEALIKRGVSKAQALTKAASTAEELIFRKSVDIANKTGQGYFLSNIDKLTSTVYKLREIPGVKWFVPFVQTPMNILKQGIEYSPLGVVTLIGNANKVEQLGKITVGSMVFGVAGWAALQDKTTWAIPKNEKDREAFYAAHMQPYSVQIGDKWISYSKLGPLAYPFAMAAAIKYYTKDNPKSVTDDALAKTMKAFTGIAQFFSDQSYVEGIGDLVEIISGGERAVNKVFRSITSPATQLVPLASLQRWVTAMIDPIYRKPSKDMSIDTIIDNLIKGIPFVSKTVEPYTDLEEQPSRRDYPIINALSPMTVSKEIPEYKEYYEERMLAGKERALLQEERKKYKEEFELIDKENMPELLMFINEQSVNKRTKVIRDIYQVLRQKGLPTKYWYENLKTLPPSIRIKIFENKLKKSSPENKVKIMQAAHQMGGILTKGYYFEKAIKDIEELNQ